MNKLLNAMKIWMIAFLMITIIQFGLQDWLTSLSIYAKSLILSGIMVFGLQYMVFPMLKWLEQTKHEKQ